MPTAERPEANAWPSREHAEFAQAEKAAHASSGVGKSAVGAGDRLLEESLVQFLKGGSFVSVRAGDRAEI
ncbi:MAG TPA: hypothetical protein QGF35_06715, partial [Dehalococcoidia bacterium]|nr:hypothetical protein [Dehalococcoidia bacterium]